MNYVYYVQLSEDFAHVTATSMPEAWDFMVNEVGHCPEEILSISLLGPVIFGPTDE